MCKFLRFCLASLLLVAICAIGAMAQSQASTGQIVGTVKNPNGELVPGATVTVTNPANGLSRSVTTNDQGGFTAPNLPSGEYELTTSASGFDSKSVMVHLGSTPQTEDVALIATAGPSLSDLGFNTADTKGNADEQARLDKRTRMLKIHQKMGLITAVPLAATIISGFGAGGHKTSSSTRDLHAALGSATVGLYFTTAYFAIRAPKISGTETRGPIRVHKALAWVHGTGMILTPILGAMAFQQKSRGEHIHGIAQAHGPVAIITGAAYGAALLSVSVKF